MAKLQSVMGYHSTIEGRGCVYRDKGDGDAVKRGNDEIGVAVFLRRNDSCVTACHKTRAGGAGYERRTTVAAAIAVIAAAIIATRALDAVEHTHILLKCRSRTHEHYK